MPSEAAPHSRLFSVHWCSCSIPGLQEEEEEALATHAGDSSLPWLPLLLWLVVARKTTVQPGWLFWLCLPSCSARRGGTTCWRLEPATLWLASLWLVAAMGTAECRSGYLTSDQPASLTHCPLACEQHLQPLPLPPSQPGGGPRSGSALRNCRVSPEQQPAPSEPTVHQQAADSPD
ncbi:uncharacterized protein LOC129138464 [Pan troglodytes]|uniref:uncharacterized protein LOC129138464 n=1 Tax=Pan troglodytes TaxID=9598 RepID=UPI0023EF6C50|nr:uncharacterized protein LOC129138464 [Pan troglodytes]